MTDCKNFEALLDDLLHAYGHSIGRYGNNRHERLIEAKAAVLQAYAAGREGQPPVAWCIRAYGTLFYHEGGTDKAGVESNLRRNWDREVEDGDAELVAFYDHPAPKADAAADWVDTLTRAADMLDAYFQLMHEKVRWDELERWHYMPEVGEFAEKLRSLAASPARVGEGEKDAALDSPVAYLKKLPEGRFGIFCKTPEQLRRLDAFPPEGPLYAAPVDEEPTEEMVVAGFECEAWDALGRAVMKRKGWPYSCRESAECVTGIYKAMRAAMSREAQG